MHVHIYTYVHAYVLKLEYVMYLHQEVRGSEIMLVLCVIIKNHGFKMYLQFKRNYCEQNANR